MTTNTLKNKTLFITGASRGIGREIALRAARDGANVVIAAKTADAHPKLPGTIFSVAEEVNAAGGRARAIQLDVREEEAVRRAMAEAAEKFGGLDILINNAGAIQLSTTAETAMKRYDLMQSVNTRAVFLCSQSALPYLKKSSAAHILNLSPPLNLNPAWLGRHVAYTISKYGMTLCTLGMAEEFAPDKIAVNSLWPRTLIHTAAINMLLGEAGLEQARKPSIMADAAYLILTSDPTKLTGQTLLDEDVLRKNGQTDFEAYSFKPGAKLLPDLFLD